MLSRRGAITVLGFTVISIGVLWLVENEVRLVENDAAYPAKPPDEPPQKMLYGLDPIFDHAEAIARTRDYVGISSPTWEAARLLTYETVDTVWFGLDSSDVVEDWKGSWLVGLTAPGLTDSIISEGLGMGTSYDRPIPGIYMVWDANGGELYSLGELQASGQVSKAALEVLVDEQVEIVRATPLP